MIRRAAVSAVVVAAVGATLAAAGCTVDIAGKAPNLVAPPRDKFESVAKAMQPTCGTLDCHGQIGRNMRLYGIQGLRLDPMSNSLTDATSNDEYDASYWSIVALEPEAMTKVVESKGGDPESLSLIRKARGREKHKGKTLMNPNDPNDHLDPCLMSWLASDVDTKTCDDAVNDARNPMVPPGP